MESPQFHSITICYNGFKDTCKLIESLLDKIHSISYEIIVVRQCFTRKRSREDTCVIPYGNHHSQRCKQRFFGRKQYRTPCSKRQIFFLINNDTYIESDNITCLIERLESRPEIGGVSPKIRFAFPPQNIQFAGYTPLSSITLRNEGIGFGCPDDGRFDTPHTTPYLHGAAMMVKREVIESRNDAGDILSIL